MSPGSPEPERQEGSLPPEPGGLPSTPRVLTLASGVSCLAEVGTGLYQEPKAPVVISGHLLSVSWV